MPDPAAAPARAVFLDRDDTLIRNIPYLGDPARVTLLPTVPEALARLRAAGYQLIVISNQSGVGRGLITPAQVTAVNQAMERLIGFPMDAYYLSYAAPGTPEAETERKPSPHLLFRAREERSLDLSASCMIGDKTIDIECARNAGCRAALWVRTGTEPTESAGAQALADHSANTLLEAANWILQQP